MTPPPIPTLLALSHHQLLFSFLAVIHFFWEEGCYKGFMIPHTGYAGDTPFAHMGLCM